MDYGKTLAEINESWQAKRLALTGKEIAYIGNKASLRGKLLGFLTGPYYKRTKLIQTGDIYYAFVFKEWSNDVQGEDPQHPTWMVFSPERKLNENPELLKGIAEKLQGLAIEKNCPKDLRVLRNLIVEPLSDTSYFELPQEYTNGELAYLSIVYVIPSLVPCFHLGLNLILANQSVSKEVLYLPTAYWSDGFSSAYLSGKVGL